MIIRLKGGLGNQMFQYAFALQLKKNYGIDNILIDKSFYNNTDKVKITQYGSMIDDFNINYRIASERDLKNACIFPHNQQPMTLSYRVPMLLEILFNKNYYHVKNFKYVDPENLLNYKYLDGSWQSWRYLQGIEEEIRNSFIYTKQISEKILFQIKEAKNSESVFVGIRRGDYVINSGNKKLYGELGESYYNHAMKIILEQRPNARFYVMSDDIEWVKKNIQFSNEVTYREKDMVGNAHEEIAFMKSCKHAVIANSTFHWWGAWLNQNPTKIIIAPKEWFADGSEIDILPPEWTAISRINN